MRESELLAHIAAGTRRMDLDARAGWSVAIGPGDDAAVLVGPGGGRLLITVDQLVGGRHFEEATTPVELIARKAVARSVSDIAAMGGRPAWGLATGLLPAGYAQGRELFDAMHAWARRWGCPLVGGDIAFHAMASGGGAAHPMVLTVTVAGVAPEGHNVLTRAGAKAGDGVYVTGPIGGSLQSRRHLTFEPRVEAGLFASEVGSGVSAAIDISDGLGRDAGRIGAASGVVVRLDAASIPLHPERAGDVPAACADGEDYELILTGRDELMRGVVGPRMVERAGVRLVRIGVCERVVPGAQAGAELRVPDGRVMDASELGWDHRG